MSLTRQLPTREFGLRVAFVRNGTETGQTPPLIETQSPFSLEGWENSGVMLRGLCNSYCFCLNFFIGFRNIDHERENSLPLMF